MTKQRHQFSHSNTEFFAVLRERVNDHFLSNNISRYGNKNMVSKTVFMFILFLLPYAFIVSGIELGTLLTLGLWMIMGFGMAGIGLSVMHDANHGAYSNNSRVNKLVGYSMNLLGANAELWKLQHNVLHHTYTNVHGVDDDIDTAGIMRFSPFDKKRKLHRFQFLYAWLFYGISTLSWVTLKDFWQVFRYRKMELIKGKRKFRQVFTQLTLWKVFYYGYILVLPLIFSPASAWVIIIGFIMMHTCAGLILSMIFQTAHVMPECEFEMADEEGKIDSSWVLQEMRSTTNYAPASKVFSWLIGGLNFQIEHHLFPKVCHVHYKAISKIVSNTAREYGIPYNSQKTFFSAILSHAKMLYKLGKREPALVPSK